MQHHILPHFSDVSSLNQDTRLLRYTAIDKNNKGSALNMMFAVLVMT